MLELSLISSELFIFILIFFFLYTTGAPYMPGNFFFAIDGFLKVVTGVRFSCGCIKGQMGALCQLVWDGVRGPPSPTLGLAFQKMVHGL